MARKPQALKKGDVIGLVAPASPVHDDELDKCIEVLCDLGYHVKLGNAARKTYGYLAGEDPVRAQDLEEMFVDPEVKAIFCLRGGYGSLRILDRIDYEKIRVHPKIFVGYSDITAFHLAIRQCAGLVTFHGPMASELAARHDRESWDALWSILSGRMLPNYVRNENFFSIVPGYAKGELIGGNLSLLCSTLGTPFEIETNDKILFMEEVDEEVYAVDRMLTQLCLARKFDGVRGIVLTDFRLNPPKKKKPSIPFREMVEKFFAPMGIPCFYGLSAGHCQPNFTLPIGVRVRLDSGRGLIQLMENPVIPS